MLRAPPTSPLFPYTTLFRSGAQRAQAVRALSVAAEVFCADACPRPAVLAGFPLPGLHVRDLLLAVPGVLRSEEHTSELQSLRHLVCRLLLEKKKKITLYGSI